MKKPKANRLHLFSGESKVTDHTNQANSRHTIHPEFEHMQETSTGRSQYILTTGASEDRLKQFLYAKLNRDIDNLLAEFEWCKTYGKTTKIS